MHRGQPLPVPSPDPTHDRIREPADGRVDAGRLADLLGGWAIAWPQACASTNQVAMQAPFGDRPAGPALVGTTRQTAGRGRRGRGWTSPAGTSLTFSMAFERGVADGGAALGGWSIAAGIAIAEALRAWAPELRLKWPNDLQRAGRKCAGILVELRHGGAAAGIERVVVGVGVNLLPDPALQHAVDQPLVALVDRVEGLGAREAVVAAVARSVAQAWTIFSTQGLAPFRARWAALDALAGQPVRVVDAGRLLFEGVADGLEPGGELRVRTAEGVRSVVAGDVSVRAVRDRVTE
jgi:BirA family biotin operon repressor/biotin-[acetyl-CoA-carboxylase] ligase